MKPIHYDLNLTPNFESFNYTGSASILVSILEETDTIVTNAVELQINAVTSSNEYSRQNASSIEINAGNKTATFKFKKPFAAGSNVTISIDFGGTHNNHSRGFFRNKYDDNGSTKYVMATHFEPIDARKAFPCWDEPGLKATFNITLNVPVNHTALSNMESIHENIHTINGTQLKTVVFAESPIMSTYLVAFAIGELEFMERTTKPKIPIDAQPVTVRVYGTKGNQKLANTSLDIAIKSLEFYSEKFNMSYPLKKLDMLGVTSHPSNGMENWGLILYKVDHFYFDDVSESNSVYPVITVAHEIAHQWFGNKVTMKWWDDLWLNEGFATFMSMNAVNVFRPQWKVWEEYQADSYTTFGTDSLRSTHPIEMDIPNSTIPPAMFDNIEYQKACSALRMLSYHLGEETFYKGVQHYLHKFSYSNTKASDLWDSLSVKSGQNVSTVMDSWIKNAGYPVVSVSDEKFDPATQQLTLVLNQKRLLATGDLKPEEDSLWNIPITITSHLNPKNATKILFNTKQMSVNIPYQEQQGSFWKINADYAGFYRVAYSRQQQKNAFRCRQS